MPKWLIFIVVLPLHSALAVPVWTWVDANGTVHYSDTPVPGAREIELSSAQGFSVPTPARTTRGDSQTEQSPAGNYQTLSVASPGPQETLWSIGSTLNVLVELAPALQPTHRLDLVLDGQRLQLNSNRLQFTVPNVFRGEHTLQAVVVDSAGEVLQSSPPVTFYVQQTSIQNPNSLPGRRAGRNAN